MPADSAISSSKTRLAADRSMVARKSSKTTRIGAIASCSTSTSTATTAPGLGASHQTGWTGVIARIDAPICDNDTGKTSLEGGKEAYFESLQRPAEQRSRWHSLRISEVITIDVTRPTTPPLVWIDCTRPTRRLARTLRVCYPGRSKEGWCCARNLNWDRDVEPIAVSADGNTSTFELEADQPYLYFKPCLIQNGDRNIGQSGPTTFCSWVRRTIAFLTRSS